MAEFPSIGGWLHTFSRAGVDFLYPPCCPLCNADLTTQDLRTGGVCPDCWAGLVRSRGTPCFRCGAPIGPNLDPALGCLYCHDEHFVFDRVFCLGVYENELRSACLRAKQTGAEPLASALGSGLAEHHREALAAIPIDVVVGIPQHWRLRWRRPHHAAETLAAALARRLKLRLSRSILKKVRATRFQAELNLTERRKNLKNAFDIGRSVFGRSFVGRSRVIAGATVLLVDDILTTGTTVNEASRVLKKAGASRVIVAVLARGLGHKP